MNLHENRSVGRATSGGAGRAISRSLVITLLSATAALLPTPSVSAQCDEPQGNASLAIGGLPNLGSNLSVTIEGPPGGLLVLATSPALAPTPLHGGGTVCLDLTKMTIILDGLSNPLFHLSALGEFHTNISIPPREELIGSTFHFQAFTTGDPGLGGAIAISNLVSLEVTGAQPVDSLYFDDFEAGWGDWFASNGVWQIGTPAVGPTAPFSGAQCAGTVLTGDYPNNANSRLTSPAIGLPAVAEGERIMLAFWTWFATETGYDGCVFEISAEGGPWTTLCAKGLTGSGGVWTQAGADLTEFAGQSVQLGFRIYSDFAVTSVGAYIDDVHVYRGVPVFDSPSTFEDGLGSWWIVENGLWQAGTPTSGPSETCSGTQCVGTVLGGSYSNSASARLRSPRVTLPGTGSPTLVFCSWTSTETGYDGGVVQISLDDGCTWQTVSGLFTGSSGGWTQAAVDLSAFAGEDVLIGFLFTSDFAVNAAGWYLDDIRIE